MAVKSIAIGPAHVGFGGARLVAVDSDSVRNRCGMREFVRIRTLSIVVGDVST